MSNILPALPVSASATHSCTPPLSLLNSPPAAGGACPLVGHASPVDGGGLPRRGGLASGLVFSQTSGTSTHQPPIETGISALIFIDRESSRLKRLRSSVLTAARLHCHEKSKWRVCMVTLTYAPEFSYEPQQMAALVRHIRQYLKRKGVEMRYVWVQEFTKRGKPHYHLLVWLPLGLTLPKPDKRGWWPCGMTKIEWARNAIGYIAKYASKGDSLHRPAPGARMHGNGGLTGAALLEQRWWKLPGWARDLVKPSDACKRNPQEGGGILNPETGEILTSPWQVVFHGGHVFIHRRDAEVFRYPVGCSQAERVELRHQLYASVVPQ